MEVAPEVVLRPATVADDNDTWDVDLPQRWNVGRNQNGGILLAAAAGALAEATGQPHPFAVTGHYLAATEAGPATIRTTVVKPGRTYATAQGELWQGDRERTRVVGSFGDLDRRAQEGPNLVPAPPEAIPAPDQCQDLFELLVAGPAGEKALTRSIRNYEIRIDPTSGWGADPTSGQPTLKGWMRFRDADTVTASMLVAAADGFPPSLMSATEIGWLPTIELTVHLFGLPPADEPWLRADLRTRSVVGGLLDEDGELWDASGRLVARFRQLAMLIPRDS
jgi:acyl-CoA thioesterase